MKRLLVLVLLCVALPAFGADANRNYKTIGARSCGAYIDERNRLDDTRTMVAIEDWVAGWITAYNVQTPDTYDIMGSADLKSVMLWIEDWCKANPLKHLSNAMDSFAEEQYPSRKRKKE